MIQLIVDGHFLDLYDATPPKLTFQIEDITDTSATSIFSRQFRLPATQRNFQFFKTAFLINGQDFDVTQKYDAQILVDGNEFRRGQFRLNRVYVNEVQSIIDYECIFLGETRSFASALGEGFLNELDLNEYNHVNNYANVVASWQAYPEGGLNDGLFNGDILYPLIDFGNTYDADGIPEQSRISALTTGAHFTQNSHPLLSNRFKPMIRAKVLWDKCFEEAGFTYSSQFLESDLFRHIYVSAFGNQASPELPEQTTNLLNAILNGTEILAADFTVPFNNIQDNGGNWDALTYEYIAPLTGAYTFITNITGSLQGDAPAGGEIQVGIQVNGVYVSSIFVTAGAGASTNFTFNPGEVLQGLTAGDLVKVEVIQTAGSIGAVAISSQSYFQVSAAPGEVNVASMLQNKYKKLDFIKDILTKFRLVMSPDSTQANRFIIEPWADYIATGDYYDWTQKVDLSKDMQISPLFYTQAESITFKDAEEEDFLNKLNREEFREVFGELLVDSNNELLTGSREITTLFAPTPVTQVEGAENGSIQNREKFVIPQIHIHEPGTNSSYPIQHVPIAPQTRLLFYNGILPTGDSPNQGDRRWFFYDDVAASAIQYEDYPMVSYFEAFPPQAGGLNLNWQVETGYLKFGIFNGLIGTSVYDRYWAQYIDSLYDRFARRVTVYVKLSSIDLQDFSFDDVVFIKDTYYYVEKIYDAPIGREELVKVDLIKLNRVIEIQNQVPPIIEDVWNNINENFNEVDEDWNLK